MSPNSTLKLFHTVALLEALSWIGLLVGMAVKYGPAENEVGVQIFGPLHGGVFMAYVLVTLVVARQHEWSTPRTLVALLASIPPLATAVFDVWLRRTNDIARVSA